MARSVILLVIGMVAGGAVAYLHQSRVSGEHSTALVAGQPPLPARQPPRAGAPDSAPAGNGRVAARIALLQKAAAADDALDLEGMIDVAAARPASFERDLELETLLARLGELDPARAVYLARSLYLEPRFLEPVFRAWAVTDADAAIVAVALIDSPATRRKMALALLDVVGFDAYGVGLIAAGLPEAERAAFEVGAIIRRAETDPMAALQSALALSRSTLQQTALMRIAESAGRLDPLTALAQSETIGDVALRQLFSSFVMNAWAANDPEAVFAWIESPGFDDYEVSARAFPALAESDPERLLALAESLPTQIRANAQQVVLTSMAETDPIGALALLDELIPPGADRNSALQSIATVWGERDPDAALAWARSLSPRSQEALTGVLRGVSQVDFDLAIDAVIAEVEQSEPDRPGLPMFNSSLGLTLIFALGPGGDIQFDRIADRLADIDQPAGRNLLRSIMSRWSNANPDSALDWAIANTERIDPSVVQTLAMTFARENPNLAIQTLSRIPSSQQQGWIEGVVQGLASTDLDRAIDFISQYRGQPAFDNAIISVVMQAARSDPRRAADLIADSSASPRVQAAAAMLASQWAQQDPRAAIEFAAALDDQRAQSQAMQQIASAWALADAGAARTWLRDMPQGDNRDAAVSGYLSSMAQFGSFEEDLLDAYSSDAARQQGMMNVVLQLGRTDQDQARRLLETHITDPRLRRQAEEMLLRTSGVGNGGIVAPSPILIF